MSKFNVENFELNIAVCTLEEYMCETDLTESDIEHDWGKAYAYYVRGYVVQDDYMQRFFVPVKRDTKSAVQQLMEMLMEDYGAYLRSTK
jgi:hypothetical protein